MAEARTDEDGYAEAAARAHAVEASTGLTYRAPRTWCQPAPSRCGGDDGVWSMGAFVWQPLAHACKGCAATTRTMARGRATVIRASAARPRAGGTS